MTITSIFALCALGGYLLGSIPFGLVLTRLAGLGDIRKIGSGNIGATNVLRTGRKDLALLTVLLDASKAGIAAFVAASLAPAADYVFLGNMTQVNVIAGLIAGSAGVVGHNFPVWLKFKGGKGVASTFGLFSQPIPRLPCWLWPPGWFVPSSPAILPFRPSPRQSPRLFMLSFW